MLRTLSTPPLLVCLALLGAPVLASAQESAAVLDLDSFPGIPASAVVGAPTGCVGPIGEVRGGRVPVCPPDHVAVPADWYSGDTHDHVQLCFSLNEPPEAKIVNHMVATGLDVTSLLIWGGHIDETMYVSSYLPLVTGAEDPITVGLPEVLQYGVETSGFRCARLGHVIGLNIGTTEADIFPGLGCMDDDGSGDYPAPILDQFKLAANAVTGYAHVTWPTDLHVPAAQGGFDWEEPSLPAYVGADAVCSQGQDMAFPQATETIVHPTLAAIDVAMGKIDFIESVDMLTDFGVNIENRWYGMYYKLLNAGVRVGISGGTDADCVGTRLSGCEPRTWVQVESGQPLDYANWAAGLEAGRVSLANGSYQFLELTVDGMPPGSQIDLTTPGMGSASVLVTATLHVADGVTIGDTIEIVQDGVVVASEPLLLQGGGQHQFQVSVPITESGWLAARTRSLGTHTGAVYAILDVEPITSCEDAEYWVIYCDRIRWLLDLAAAVPDPEVLEAWVGCSETEIRDYVDAGRAVFAALRDAASGPPPHADRAGVSTPWEAGPGNRQPIGIGLDDTVQSGAPAVFHCFNAPPSTVGALLFSPTMTEAPVRALGADLFVLGAVEHLLAWPADTNSAGYAESVVPTNVPPGTRVYAQYVWLNPGGPGQPVGLSASDVLVIDVQ